jgi:hypothetical protein
MQKRQGFVRSGFVLAILAGAGLISWLPAGAADPAKPSTSAMAPANAEDNAAEFAKIDKNKDGFIDKTEAIAEPKLLGKWGDADANKDGKVSKDEFLAFQRKEHAQK